MEEETKKEVMSFRQSLWEFVKFAAIAALIVVPIRMWIAQPFIVSGSSMSPNFENGEYLVVDEFSYKFKDPQRGDVVIFRYPEVPSKFFIKRIVGLPNEIIEINKNNLYVYNKNYPSGILINENYIDPSLNNPSATINMKVQLDEKEYFVLGDNRPVSSDSRSWGALPANLIVGRAWIRLWPLQKASISF